MNFDLQLFKYGWVKSIVPSCVIGGLAYISFASFYSLGYEEIYKRHSVGAAICLWVLMGISLLLVLWYWFMIYRVGPGRCPKIRPFDLYQQKLPEYIPVPERFPCDENGYPYFCSECQSIRPPRSFHSKDVGYCVRKFDHYCLWIGTVIGQNNYLFFMKYMMWFLVFFCVLLVFLAVYTQISITHDRPDINYNFVVLYIMCGFWILMISALLIQHVRYICIGSSTFDDVTTNQHKKYERWKARKIRSKPTRWNNIVPRKEDGIRYLNIRKDDHRVVVKYGIKDISYSMGPKRNWIDLIYHNNGNTMDLLIKGPEGINRQFFKSLLIFCIPLFDFFYVKKLKQKEIEDEYGSDTYTGLDFRLSEASMKFLESKIAEGECYVPSYMSTPFIESTESSKNSSNEK